MEWQMAIGNIPEYVFFLKFISFTVFLWLPNQLVSDMFISKLVTRQLKLVNSNILRENSELTVACENGLHVCINSRESIT